MNAVMPGRAEGAGPGMTKRENHPMIRGAAK